MSPVPAEPCEPLEDQCDSLPPAPLGQTREPPSTPCVLRTPAQSSSPTRQVHRPLLNHSKTSCFAFLPGLCSPGFGQFREGRAWLDCEESPGGGEGGREPSRGLHPQDLVSTDSHQHRQCQRVFAAETVLKKTKTNLIGVTKNWNKQRNVAVFLECRGRR